MARSIVGLFPDRASAEAAIRDLTAAGFNTDRIGLVMRDPGEARDVAEDHGVESMAGAVAGGAIGGTAGAVLAATGALAVPGIGPFITGGILATLVGGTAGWLIGGLAGMGVPRDEAEYYQGRVEQGNVLVTVDPQGRDDEARQILLRNGAEGERAQGVGARPATGATPYPTGTTGPYAADRANLGATAQSAYPPPRGDNEPPTADPQRFPPADSGIAPGTMAQERSPDQDLGGAAPAESSVGSELGGVQPSAVSDQTSGAAGDDLQHLTAADSQDRPRQPDTGIGAPNIGEATQRPSPHTDTVTSAAAQEGADYNRGTRRESPDRPITDADIIADAEGRRRQTNPDLDVGAEDATPSEQRGLY